MQTSSTPSPGARCQTTEDASEGAKIIEKYKQLITDTKKMRVAKAMRSTCIPFRRIATSEVTSE